MENKEQDLDLDIDEDNKNIKYINNNTNEKPIYKLDFNFDILNEPLPDFTKSKKKQNGILNMNNNITYKRRYNEINDNSYSIRTKAIPKFS